MPPLSISPETSPEPIDEKLELQKIKRMLFEGERPEIPERYLPFSSEWVLSSKLNIDPSFCDFGSTRDMSIFDRLNPQHYTHLSYLSEYYRVKKEYFAKIGAAIFYLDENLSAFEKGGESSLLTFLKAHEVRIGTSFTQENVGVFVSNLARQKPFETVFRYGNENYLDLFSNFVCYARYGNQEASNFSTVNLIFLPLENYTPAVHDSICYALSVEDLTFKNRFVYPAVEQKIGLLEKSAGYSPDAFLLINQEGEVIFTDKHFEREFGRSVDSSQAIPLKECIPELSPYLALLKGKALVPFECFISNAQGESRFYPIKSHQITKDDGSIIGLKISITSKQSLKNTPTTRSALFTFSDLIGNSPCFLHSKEIALSAADSPSNALIIGESGTGKEMFAQAIHNASSRRDNRFIPINCGAIPKELIGSELFGYEGGAFTGARKEGAPGKFEQANGGTVFLDEIAEMPLDMQSFLLRFLEDGVVSRIGSKKFLNLDVRIIAATNKNLWEYVNKGMFRLDLYYRLNVLRLDLPPLRDRIDDMELLVNHFLSKLSNRIGKHVSSVSPEVLNLLKQYSWQGNLRELRNILERSVNLCSGIKLTIEDIPPDVVRTLSGNPHHHLPEIIRSDEAEGALPQVTNYEDYESSQIRMLMIKHRGNKSRVADELGMSRSTLYRKLKNQESPVHKKYLSS